MVIFIISIYNIPTITKFYIEITLSDIVSDLIVIP